MWGASCFLQLQEIIGRLEQDVPRNKRCLSVPKFVSKRVDGYNGISLKYSKYKDTLYFFTFIQEISLLFV